MPPRRRPWPALQIDVGEGGFAGLAERREEARARSSNVAADESNRASMTTTKSNPLHRASYAEAARRSANNSSVSASAMLSFCDDGRLKPSAFGAAIRAGREGAMRPSEFSVSAVATATAATEGGGEVGGGGAGTAPAPQQQEQLSTSARVKNDAGRKEAWHQLAEKDVILGGVLGRGASSVVHSGTIASTGEKVAVKRLSAADGATARSIVNELRALAPRSSASSSSSSSLPSSPSSSSGLVELRGAYAEAGGARLAVVLELMPGGSLADAIARRGAAVRRRARRKEREAEKERKRRIEEEGKVEGACSSSQQQKQNQQQQQQRQQWRRRSFVPFGLPERAVARVALGALTGLARIRELGLVHRDVKPANILLDGDVVALCERLEEEREEEGKKRLGGDNGDDESDDSEESETESTVDPFSSLNAKVADFGLASAGAAGGAAFDGSIAACTTFVGTVTYMSPERATSGGNPGSGDGGGDGGGYERGSGGGERGGRAKSKKAGYSAPADIWALGLTLMEAATGIYPYALVSRGGGKGGSNNNNSNSSSDNNSIDPAATAARAIAAAGPLALLMQVVTDPAPVLPDNGAGFTASFADFLARCLEKDPAKRATARELLSHPWVVSGGRGKKVKMTTMDISSSSSSLRQPQPRPPPPPAAPAPAALPPPRPPLRLPSASFSSSSRSPSASGSAPSSPDAAAAAGASGSADAAASAPSPRDARGASASPPPPPPPPPLPAACFSSPERASSPPTLLRSGGGEKGGGGGVGIVVGGARARATTAATTTTTAQPPPPPPRLPSNNLPLSANPTTTTTATATAADARALALAAVRARFSSLSLSAPGARRAALAPLYYGRGVSLRLEGRPVVLRGARAALDAWDAEASGMESLGAKGEAEVSGVDVLPIGGAAAREALEAVEREREDDGDGNGGGGGGDNASAAAAAPTTSCYLVHVTGTLPGPALGPFAAAAAASAAAAAAGGGGGGGGAGGSFSGQRGGRRVAFAEALVCVCCSAGFKAGRARGGVTAAAEGGDVSSNTAAAASSSLPFGGLRITSHTFRTLR